MPTTTLKAPSKELLDQLYELTVVMEKEIGKSDAMAKTIARKAVDAFKDTWIYFAN